MGYLIHHFLSESAARDPAKEALRFEGKSMTYGELDQVTNRIARALHAAGVKRGDRVGLYLHKSFESVIGVFSIMKAGAAYVPLDPGSPAKRLGFICNNCNVEVVLTASKSPEPLPELLAMETSLKTVVFADSGAPTVTEGPAGISFTNWDQVASQDGSSVPDQGAIETDLAYILYTSGSTGDPKGVMIAHRTCLTFINWCFDTFKLTPDDRITSNAPLHFDLSTFDLYATVMAGATIVLVPEGASVFPIKLAALLQDEKVTITYLVPSLLSTMVKWGKLESMDYSALRAILFAGEVFPIKYLRQLTEKIPHVDYYNLYGPTETNVCTYYKVQEKDLAPDKTEPCPIGIACENTEVFIVGDDGKIVTEIGVKGELWARGSCVAQGYWGNPERTKQSFVLNTHQPHYAEWAYKTGDIVFLDEDGKNIIYSGRRDSMVKTRGYRVELGEIETALNQHEAIDEVAVIAVPDATLGNLLAAFVVTVENKTIEAKEVKKFCGAALPQIHDSREGPIPR